jgi:DNA polymerase-3 subunit alpha
VTDETALGRPRPIDYTPAYHLSFDPAEDMPPFSDPVFTGLARDVLCTTRGALVFREQAMMLLITVAGCAFADAERLRKALGKRDLAALASIRPAFVDGAVAAGVSRAFAEAYWDEDILALAR